MPIIDRANWVSLEPLLDQALDLEPEERSRWLRELSERSPVLAAELTAFLDEEALADRRGFLSGMPDVSLEGLELGAYRLERPLGQGGMGTVWLARRTDGRFEGVAALKLLNLAMVNPTAQERFRREGSVLARLAHPGIARLLDAGISPTGQPYLVLEHVDGVPIDEFVRSHNLSAANRIRLVLQVLDAVGHAHANLIVHRDLKPSNILVTADGTVKLLDFGIAKLLDGDTGDDRTALTLEGGRVFTPQYAAPEQIRGETLTTATDVYSLGVLLYVLLSGRHPTGERSRTPAEMVHALLEREPEPLGQGDLDTVLDKALRKPPAERYQTVAAFADDLNRFLRQEPVSARPQSMAYRFRKFVRRNQTGVITGALTAAGLVAATIFSIAQTREAQRQRDEALQQRRFADAQVDFQNALLSQVGEKPITMREALDSARVVLDRRFAADPEMLLPLLIQLSDSYGEMGSVDISEDLLSRAESLAIANRLQTQLPTIRCARADNWRLQGKYEDAWRGFMAADSLPEANDPRARASCLARRAALGSEADSAEQSVVWARQAMSIMDSLGENRDLTYISVLNSLAYSYNATGQLRESVAMFRRALGLMDSTGYGSTSFRIMAEHNLALTLVDLGLTRDAEAILHRVLLTAAAMDPEGQIPWQPLVHYAEVALYQGHADSAARYFGIIVRQAVEKKNLFWEGRGSFGVGRAQARLGHFAEAIRARTRLDAIIHSYPHVRGTDDVLPDGPTIDGWIALAKGDTAAAATSFTAALTNNGYFEGKQQHRMALVALQLAEIRLALGRPVEALDLVHKTMENVVTDSLSLSESAKAGQARLIEGGALLALGDTAKGRTAIGQALTALLQGGGPDFPETLRAQQLMADLDR
ncbi:MAG: serine/threonine-protein kinase [Gemmatimonadota bacterium]